MQTPAKRYVIMVAGGQGTRMGASVPKQFLELEGKPILQLSIEKFIQASPGIRIVTVLPKDHLQEWKTMCLKRNFIYPQTLVAGGITRFHSVKNALAKIPDGAIVAVHDGVRPLISEKLISELFARVEDGARAVMPVVPSTDTLKAVRKVVDANGCEHLETVPGIEYNRSEIFGAQTPQLFRSEDIRKAYAQAYDTSFTDDASVVMRMGVPMDYLPGERFNLKITTPEDLSFASFFLRELSK